MLEIRKITYVEGCWPLALLREGELWADPFRRWGESGGWPAPFLRRGESGSRRRLTCGLVCVRARVWGTGELRVIGEPPPTDWGEFLEINRMYTGQWLVISDFEIRPWLPWWHSPNNLLFLNFCLNKLSGNHVLPKKRRKMSPIASNLNLRPDSKTGFIFGLRWWLVLKARFVFLSKIYH